MRKLVLTISLCVIFLTISGCAMDRRHAKNTFIGAAAGTGLGLATGASGAEMLGYSILGGIGGNLLTPEPCTTRFHDSASAVGDQIGPYRRGVSRDCVTHGGVGEGYTFGLPRQPTVPLGY